MSAPPPSPLDEMGSDSDGSPLRSPSPLPPPPVSQPSKPRFGFRTKETARKRTIAATRVTFQYTPWRCNEVHEASTSGQSQARRAPSASPMQQPSSVPAPPSETKPAAQQMVEHGRCCQCPKTSAAPGAPPVNPLGAWRGFAIHADRTLLEYHQDFVNAMEYAPQAYSAQEFANFFFQGLHSNFKAMIREMGRGIGSRVREVYKRALWVERSFQTGGPVYISSDSEIDEDEDPSEDDLPEDADSD
ncbi:uncharacterized protein LOC112087824 [Eutrema salsugineum]|uniref:uncharacterized protein LOC112087824 n=1 Tax=Eutrema salsugineum TaxID=72664 RepID=UPI000CED3A37|nr:uncharacterized protein LOC112087824 [Eutrema salsugineum]